MHDEGPFSAACVQITRELVEDRTRFTCAGQRYREQPGRLVEHDHRVVFVNDVKVPGLAEDHTAVCAAGPVDPDVYDIAGAEPRGPVSEADLCAVDEHLAAFEGG